MSWNVDSIRVRLPQVLSWIEEYSPDVICLQETKCGNERFPAAAFRDRGFSVATHGAGGHGGVALLSRLDVEDLHLGIPGAVAPLDEPRSISATVEGVRIHTVYAPNGRKVGTAHHALKLAWFQLLAAWIDIDSDDYVEVLLIGDLNIAPTDLDIWDASRYRKRNLTSPPERQAFAQLEAQGLTDIVRSMLGDQRAYTWWNRREGFFATDRGWRLDHALASANLVESVDAVWIDREARAAARASDHAPLVVDLS